MSRLVAVILVAGLAAAAPPPSPSPSNAPAPQGFLDEGVFLITRDGSEIGREEFAIRATPGRQGQGGVLAVATVHQRDRDYRAALELTNDHVPVSYQVDASQAGRVVERLTGQFGRGRFAVRRVTQTGEIAREFPVPPGVVVLDDDTFDQFYFLPRATETAPRSVMVLKPRETRVVAGQIRALGPDSVAVGDRTVGAEHYQLSLEGGDVREFWFSASGDLLKVYVPARSITATRSSLPAR